MSEKVTKKLDSGRSIDIAEMTLDQMDDCKDAARIIFEDGKASSITGTNKAKTLWLRFGLCGGDFKSSSKPKADKFPDRAIKELTEEEREQAIMLIQEAQRLGEFKEPS